MKNNFERLLEAKEYGELEKAFGGGSEFIAAYLFKKYKGKTITKKDIKAEYKKADVGWANKFMFKLDYEDILEYYKRLV